MIRVTIKNWERFNPRTDRANYTWLRFQNDFFHDQSIFALNNEQRILFVFLLCEASRRNAGQFDVLDSYAAAMLHTTPQAIKENLNILATLGMLVADCRHDAVTMTAERRQRAVTTPRYDTIRDETNDTDETKKIAPKPQTESRESGITIATWESYRAGYVSRYGVAPIRNTTINGKLAHFVRRVGAEEAPLVAEFYLKHNGARYTQSGHSVGLMLQDAEKLRTEWVTGRQVTQQQSKQLESASHNAQIAADYLASKRGGGVA